MKQMRLMHKNTVCYVCREVGHAASFCPKGAQHRKICFRCGSNDHRLQNCPIDPSRDGELPFATCYVCGETGHLSGKCPRNEKGVYVNGDGGMCKICGGKDHLERDCPNEGVANARKKEEVAADGSSEGEEEGTCYIIKGGVARDDDGGDDMSDEDDWGQGGKVKGYVLDKVGKAKF